MQLKLRPKIVQESAFGGRPARNRKAMVLSDDVFYGRAIMKIPRQALLTLETGRNPELKQELTRAGLRLGVLEGKPQDISKVTLNAFRFEREEYSAPILPACCFMFVPKRAVLSMEHR